MYENVLKTATAAVVVIGGIVTLFEYHGAQRDKAVERSLEFYRAAMSEPMVGYRTLVETMWLDDGSGARQAVLALAQTEARGSEDLVTAIKNRGAEYPVLQIVGFYDTLAICIERKLCDYETALSVFGEAITTFYNRFVPYVMHYCARTNNRHFAMRLYYVSRLWRSGRNAYSAWPQALVFQLPDGNWRAVRAGDENPHCARPEAARAAD